MNELKIVAANVARLSRLLTGERENLPSAYLKDRGLREAYEAYFLPPNLRKIHAPLRDLARHPVKLLNKDSLRVLDLGCGPGTMLLGVLEFFAADKRPHLEFVALTTWPRIGRGRSAFRLIKSTKDLTLP
jgi:ribosomal protein RSM22 (predicted rRNA methylase)